MKDGSFCKGIISWHTQNPTKNSRLTCTMGFGMHLERLSIFCSKLCESVCLVNDKTFRLSFRKAKLVAKWSSELIMWTVYKVCSSYMWHNMDPTLSWGHSVSVCICILWYLVNNVIAPGIPEVRWGVQILYNTLVTVVFFC
jgi:hypothetical protein